MARTVHLGYRCNACRTRVPVYTFTRSNGNGAQPCTPPVDRLVECPTCTRRVMWRLRKSKIWSDGK